MAKLILVAGSWGSGTTSVIGALHHLGVPTLGPFFQSNDPRTANTYELQTFRQLTMRFVNENTLKFSNNYQSDFVPSLMAFKASIKLELSKLENKPDYFALKLPISTMCIPEICQVFDTQIIMVHRPFSEIENSRLRRNWPAIYGEQGAREMYSKLISDMITLKKSFLGVSYSDFLADTESTLKEIINFCHLDDLEKNLPEAISYVRS